MDQATAQALVGDRDRIKREMVVHAKGEITSLSPLSVKVSGASTPFTGVKALTPVAVGDIVEILRWGNDLLVLGVLGSGVGWQAWTPTLTNLTLGNGTKTGRYIQVGKTVHFRFFFKLGATSAVGTNPIFSLPVTAAALLASASVEPLGTAAFLDSGTAAFGGLAVFNSTTSASLRAQGSPAGNFSLLQATYPFTWATNDEISVFGSYEAA